MAKDKEDYPLSKAEIARHHAYIQQTVLCLENDEMFKKFLSNLLSGVNKKYENTNVSMPTPEPQINNTPALAQQGQVLKKRTDDLQQEDASLREQVEKLKYDKELERTNLLQQFESLKTEKEAENMSLRDFFRSKESAYKQQVDSLNQQIASLNQTNTDLSKKVSDLNTRLTAFAWAEKLEPEFNFLQQVKAHPEIAKILLPDDNNNVLQLIAIAAQWSNVLRVWDALATQVKDNQQPISVIEQQILSHSLALYNLTLQSSQATLKTPEIGEGYDFDIHQKVSGSGGTIDQVLLAGLYNAADTKARSAVVSTH